MSVASRLARDGMREIEFQRVAAYPRARSTIGVINPPRIRV